MLFDESMDLRNILWLAPLPARTNSTGIVQWLAPGKLSARVSVVGAHKVAVPSASMRRYYYCNAFAMEYFVSGALFILDAHPDGIIFKELVPEYLDIVRTISECKLTFHSPHSDMCDSCACYGAC